MKKNCLIGLSHLITLLFGTALGLTLASLHYFLLNNSKELMLELICPIVTLTVLAIVLRVITIIVYKKHKGKFCFNKKCE